MLYAPYPRKKNSADSVPTSNFVCMKMTFVLNGLSSDLKHGGTLSNHSEVVILPMKFIAKLKDQLKSLVYKMFLNEIDFHRLFDGIFKVVSESPGCVATSLSLLSS